MNTIEILVAVSAGAFAFAGIGAVAGLTRRTRPARQKQTLEAFAAWGHSPEQWQELTPELQAYYNGAVAK